MRKSEAVLLSLTRKEAVILSDWLYRNSWKEELFSDIAEQTVFWNMDCLLEKVLDLADTTPEAVQAAKNQLL